jgi:outer membrane protein TolC
MLFVLSRAVPWHLRALCNLILFLSAVPLAHAADPRPLGFDEALVIAEQRSTRLAAQSAAVSAAAEQIARLTELPDPRLKVGIDNMPVSGPDAYSLTRDSMTMKRIGFMQEVPNSDKRKTRSERATRERALESANLDAQRASLRQDAAVAWLELYFAQRGQQVMEDLVREYQLEAETVSASVSGGRMPPATAVAVRSSLELARAGLAALVGNAAERAVGAAPDTTILAHNPATLLSGLESHPSLRIYDEREALAASEVAVAASSAKPDWGVEVSYGQRSPNFSNLLTVMVSVDLPIDKAKRQDRDVASKLSLLEQTRAQREDARRMHEADVRAMIADWEIAAQRSRRFESVLLPLARERTGLALAAYRGGRGELGAVLEARRAETETGLSLLGTELERARAWARLNHLLLHEVKP